MAVKIPVYRQQTGTPNARVDGGNPQLVRGPDLGGAIAALGQGVASIARNREQKRKEQEDSIASAYAAKTLAETQSAAARELIRLKQTADEGGAGVVDGINTWIDQKTEEAVSLAPNDASRNYLRERLTAYKGTLDISALEYETVERERWTVGSYTKGIEAAASAAALQSGQAQNLVAEQVAAIKSDRNISEPVRAKLIESAVEAVTYGEVLGDIERDPYAARTALRMRIGIGANATSEEIVLQKESAVKALAEIEELEGVSVPVAERQAAVATLMTGGTIGFDKATGQFINRPSTAATADAGFAYNALSVPKVVELLSRADADIARRENEAAQANDYGKILFQQRLQNITTQLQNGEGASLPSMAEMEFFLGPERAAIGMAELMEYQSMAGELAAMGGMTNDELAAIAVAEPTGEENREFRQNAYEMKLRRIESITKARAADPGQYVIDSSKTVAGAYAAYTAETARVAQLGERATQADMASVVNAQSRYIAVSTMEQQRIGIQTPALPKAFLSSIKTEFANGLNSDVPQMAAARLKSLAATMVGTPEAIGQVAKATGDLGAFAIDGVDGLVIKRLAEASKISEDKRKELLPADVVWADIERAVLQEFSPLIATFSVQKNADELASRYVKAGQALTAQNLSVGGSSLSITEAAREAYADLFSNNNVAVSTYRVPRDYPAPIVETGLVGFLSKMSADDITIPAAAWMTDVDRKSEAERKLRTIRQQARWVNNETGTGVFLMHAGGPVLGADGLPIQVTFSEALRMAADNPELPVSNRPRSPFEMR